MADNQRPDLEELGRIADELVGLLPESMGPERTRQLKRLSETYKSIDKDVSDILAGHLVVEREIEDCLSDILPRTGKLLTFSFSQKLDILEAVWPEPGMGELSGLIRVLNKARNSAAHGHQRSTFDKQVRTLKAHAAKVADPLLAALGPPTIRNVIALFCASFGIMRYRLQNPSAPPLEDSN